MFGEDKMDPEVGGCQNLCDTMCGYRNYMVYKVVPSVTKTGHMAVTVFVQYDYIEHVNQIGAETGDYDQAFEDAYDDTHPAIERSIPVDFSIEPDMDYEVEGRC